MWTTITCPKPGAGDVQRPSPSHGSSPPVPLTSFIGREREIALVTDLLSRPDIRLLTLTGPGGIGKTRLALEVAERARAQFPDGVVFVPLASIRDPHLVLAAIAQVLGVPEVSGQPVLTRMKAFLSERQVLLVLDNLEHLLDAAPVVAALLTHCPHLPVLATSRVRLVVSGEHLFPLDALHPEAARTLFASRAQAAVPTFAITSETAPVIDAVCARLDGLPLAIELAAARTPVLPPRALLARLDHRLDLLTGGPRDAPTRQREMRDTIAWSHDLLLEPEQQLFRRIGVFVGGFSLEAAQAVADEGTDVLAGVSTLVAASLVSPAQGVGDEPRFTMLETIREYAAEQLAANNEEPQIRCTHAHFCVALAEKLWDVPERLDSESRGTATRLEPGTEAWMQRLRQEVSNLRLALSWTLARDPTEAVRLAGALMEYWIAYGNLTEGREWITRALAVGTGAPASYRSRALLGAGWLAMDQDDLVPAEVHLTEAVAHFRNLGDARMLTLCLAHLGSVALYRGDLARAWQLFNEQWTHAKLTGQRPYIAMATMNLGRSAVAMGDLPRAQHLLEEALAIHQSASGPIGIAFGDLFLGQARLAQRAYPEALTHFRASFTAFANAGELANAARSLDGLATAMVTDQPVHAARLLGAVAVIQERVSRPRAPTEVSSYEQTVATARRALGEPAFAAAWNVGKSLSWDEVLAEVDVLMDTITEPPTPPPPEPGIFHGLTRREREVLGLLVEGRSNRAIAEILSLSQRTVENHVLHILTKLDLDSRTAAATWAVRHGLA